MLGFAIFLVMVADLGDVQMAASQAFMALLSLSFMQASGLGIAVATLVGRYIGSGQFEAAEKSFRSGMLFGLFIAGSVALLFLLIPELLIRIFSEDPDVLRMGASLLVIGAFLQFFDALGIIADGALHGAGDTRVPFVARFLLAFGLMLPLVWLLAFRLDGGLNGAWTGGLVHMVFLAIYLIWRFHSGAWKKIQI